MPAIITDTFDYDDIVRVLDLDEAFVHHQINHILNITEARNFGIRKSLIWIGSLICHR